MRYILILVLLFVGFITLYETINQEPINKSISKKSMKQKVINIITPLIKINQMQSYKLERQLSRVGYGESPQKYLAEGILKTFPFLLLTVLFFLNGNYFFAIDMIFIAFFLFQMHLDTLKKKTEKIKKIIIEELPEFLSYMTNALKTDKDITKIVASYIDAASPMFKNDLLKLLADLKTSNIDEALFMFDINMGIPLLSNYISVVRATIDGETQYAALESITIDVEVLEHETAQKYANEIPSKVSKASFVVAATTLLFFVIILIYSLVIGVNKFINA